METVMDGFDTHFVRQPVQGSSDSDSDSESSDAEPPAEAAENDSDSDAYPAKEAGGEDDDDDDDDDNDDDSSSSSDSEQVPAAAAFDEAAHAPRKGGGWGSFEIPDELKRRSGRARKQTAMYTVAAESPTPRGRAAAKRGRAKATGKQAYDSDESE